MLHYFFLLFRRPPSFTLFPYTTLFRSWKPGCGRRPPAARPRPWPAATRPPRSRPDTLGLRDRKSTRLNSSHRCISYAVFCLKKKKDVDISFRLYIVLNVSRLDL